MVVNISLDMSYLIVHSVLLVVFASIAIVAVALRFWARRIQRLALQMNDYLIVLGLVYIIFLLYPSVLHVC